MSQLPEKFLFMKVGNHAGETWEQILERKRREFDRTGKIFWGYGGNTCHPINVVQPFSRLVVKEHGGIMLIMEPIDSRADPDIVPAKEFSPDGANWEPIPEGIQVTGSRFALVLDEIKPGDLELSLNEFEVAIGPSAGKAAEQYLVGHVDKGCFVKSQQPRTLAENQRRPTRRIGYMAQMKEPYAVLLR